MNTLHVEVAALCREEARRYARRCWWADEADLRQQAWTAALAGLQRYRLDRVGPGGAKAFLRLRVRRVLQRYLLQNSSPASSSDHERHELRGVCGAPLDLEAPGPGPNAERQLTLEEWRRDVRRRLVRVVGGAHAVAMLEGVRPRGGGARRQAFAALGAAMHDGELRALWEDRP